MGLFMVIRGYGVGYQEVYSILLFGAPDSAERSAGHVSVRRQLHVFRRGCLVYFLVQTGGFPVEDWIEPRQIALPPKNEYKHKHTRRRL